MKEKLVKFCDVLVRSYFLMIAIHIAFIGVMAFFAGAHILVTINFLLASYLCVRKTLNKPL